MTEPDRRGLFGRAAGALTGRVVEAIPPEVVLDHVDVDALLDRVDVNRVLDRVDMDRLLARVDIDALLKRVDVEDLVKRSGVPDLVAQSTGRLAGGALDVGRRQIIGLDTVIVGTIGTVLRRPSAGLGMSPAALRAADGERDRQVVAGNYAGPISRLLAAAADVALMFGLFTLGVAGTDLLLGVFFDTTIQGRGDSPWSLVALLSWAFVYVVLTTTIAGRTPGKGVIGIRVVTTAGRPVRAGRVFVRTLLLPVAAAPLGLGLLPVLLGRRRRGLHDVCAGTAVVYDWGDRPARMPGPMSSFIAGRGVSGSGT